MVTPGDPVCFQPASKHWGSETRWPWGPPYVARVRGEWIARARRDGAASQEGPGGCRLARRTSFSVPGAPLLYRAAHSSIAGPCHPHSPASTGSSLAFLLGDCSSFVRALTRWERLQFYFLHLYRRGKEGRGQCRWRLGVTVSLTCVFQSCFPAGLQGRLKLWSSSQGTRKTQK